MALGCSSGIAGRSTHSSGQVRISSHRAGLSPKPQSLLQEAKEEVKPKSEELKPKLAEELSSPRKSSASQQEKVVENESSLSLAAWIGQAATDARHAQVSIFSLEIFLCYFPVIMLPKSAFCEEFHRSKLSSVSTSGPKFWK